MMGDIYLWLKDILLVVISLSFFQILIPNSKTEKYIKFIFSLVILAIILEPISIFLSKCNI